ncbi:hypothetical protein pb186bvf_000950 [Paramecium bursaria]
MSIADELQQRCHKYGKLDDQTMIARKTGAIQKDINYEKHQNIYDQKDPFIDDDDDKDEIQAMGLLDSQYDDYKVIKGDIQTFKTSQLYKDRVKLIKVNLKPEKKKKKAAKKTEAKQDEKLEQIVEKALQDNPDQQPEQQPEQQAQSDDKPQQESIADLSSKID